ncbi:hypothetical protein HI914_02399 [Erysiphe necator]|uniref:Putative upf0480 protein n=1 Tax=Uncinula necator TaxID=52586 RepID=A0A0B1PDK5_UNCNE|nr:hypothetical protein HI914_02399 [Erysiphe necator]KHJ35440.1 putative upf0480 protein [Erysiphe necator]
MHLRCILLLSINLLTIFAAHLQVFIPSVSITNSASKLPPSTHATLTTLSQIYSAPLQEKGNFNFPNVTTGSYLFEINCHAFFFAPLRVDVKEAKDDLHGQQEVVEVWGTFRGNEWDNKGETVIVQTKDEGRNKLFIFEAQMLAAKNYLTERAHFSPLNMLKNPMILMAGLTLIIVFGMPYIMDNIDPELKAEFEERQKPSAPSLGAPNPLQNFDAAAWLAGSTGGSKT